LAINSGRVCKPRAGIAIPNLLRTSVECLPSWGYHKTSLLPGGLMPIQWLKDVDTALSQARQKNTPLLLDFNAAPM